MAAFSFERSCMEQLSDMIDEYVARLVHPVDSWFEEQLTRCEKYELKAGGERAGCCGRDNESLLFFYVRPKYFRHAPALIEEFISRNGIKSVYVNTQDCALAALISEWDYEIKRESCCFIDSGEPAHSAGAGEFRTAVMSDCATIREVCKDFFDDPGGGFDTLEQRVSAGMIFMLEEDGRLMGCGIAEPGVFCKGCASIGMFTNPDVRNRGVARTILMRLKEWAYKNGYAPIAGCWYYNTVSRKSLESAGMTAVSFGFEAVLRRKEKPPLRTGNPPGELLE